MTIDPQGQNLKIHPVDLFPKAVEESKALWKAEVVEISSFPSLSIFNPAFSLHKLKITMRFSE